MTLNELQQKLALKNIQALLITRNNMFLGQDILEEENEILELTSFNGSSGSLLVTPVQAWLIVDGRYTLQARKQVNLEHIVVVEATNALLEIKKILKNNNISSLAFNPWCLSVQDVENFNTLFDGIELIECANTLPCRLSGKPVQVFEHEEKFSGLSATEKSRIILSKLPLKFDALLLTAADQVSWLANLRSHTLPDTPVLRAYALLSRDGKLSIFADNCNYPGVKPFNELSLELRRYKGKRILIDKTSTPQQILNLAPNGAILEKNGTNPVIETKLSKNTVELKGFQDAHVRDGVAVVKFLHWLDNNWLGKTEWDVVKKLFDFRKQQPLFYSDSFATIAAAGANAAIVHYQPTEKQNSPLMADSVLLLDSGAQYFDGTTDVTRTLALGNPGQDIKDNFTRVLQAHISLSTAVFPNKTTGCMLDAICRHVLWQEGKNYKHGTGHSVGHFSNVHESPFGISPANAYPISENFVTSIEPGYYLENEYGIRIENMVYTLKAQQEGFLKFANLTVIPIDKRLINKYLLSSGEQAWLDSYHHKVLSCLAPYLDTDERKWLKAACSPI